MKCMGQNSTSSVKIFSIYLLIVKQLFSAIAHTVHFHLSAMAFDLADSRLKGSGMNLKVDTIKVTQSRKIYPTLLNII